MPVTALQKQNAIKGASAGVLFYLLSLPQTYALTSVKLGLAPGSLQHVGVHAAVFAIIWFAILTYLRW